jgi:hypothetical protein
LAEYQRNEFDGMKIKRNGIIINIIQNIIQLRLVQRCEPFPDSLLALIQKQTIKLSNLAFRGQIIFPEESHVPRIRGYRVTNTLVCLGV